MSSILTTILLVIKMLHINIFIYFNSTWALQELSIFYENEREQRLENLSRDFGLKLIQ